jgi:hypothetical protein
LNTDGSPSLCGTSIKIEAVQNIYFEHDIVCFICHKSGGTMTKIGEQYKHINDCVPGMRHYNKQPRLSKLAEFAWRLPPGIQKLTNLISIEVHDVEGKIIGYSFDRP